MKVMYLYSTPGCHLCELARAIVEPLLEHYQLQLQEVDIAESDELIESYGVKIPVLKAPAHLDELCWPFDTEQASDFLFRNRL